MSAHVIDGQTGQIKQSIVTEIPNPDTSSNKEREKIYVTVADTRGLGKPQDIVLMTENGETAPEDIRVYDPNLNLLWDTSADNVTKSIIDGHYPWNYDIDGDCRDEFVGTYIIDDDGTRLWRTTPLEWAPEDLIYDHIDRGFFGDFDLNNPGKEVLVSYEFNEGALYDSQGNQLWSRSTPEEMDSKISAVGNYSNEFAGPEIITRAESLNLDGQKLILDGNGEIVQIVNEVNNGFQFDWDGDRSIDEFHLAVLARRPACPARVSLRVNVYNQQFTTLHISVIINEVKYLDMQRTIRIRLHPNNETAQVLEKTISDYTWAFNDVCKYGWENKVKSGGKLHDATYYPHRAATKLPSQLVCSARVKASEALKSAFKLSKKKVKGKKTKVSCPNSKRCPIRYDARSYTIKFNSNQLSFTTVNGRIKFDFVITDYYKQYLNWKNRSADLLKDRKGRWWFHVVMETETPTIESTKEVIGIDLGIVNPATDNRGNFYGSKHWKNIENKIFQLRRRLQKKGIPVEDSRRGLKDI